MPIYKTFGFQKKFSVGITFLNETLIAEGELEDGETIEEAITATRNRFTKLVEGYRIEDSLAANPDLNNALSEQINTDPYLQPPPIINKDWERFEIAIDNAATLEEFNKVLNQYPTFPGKFLAAVNKKRESLKPLDY